MKKDFKEFGLTIISSEVEDGSMSLFGREDIYNNSAVEDLVNNYSIKDKFAYMRQIHSNKVEIVDAPGAYDADGILCRGDLALGVRTADCVPLIIFDNAGLKGAIHISRANLGGGIVSNLKNCLDEIGADISQLYTYLGPHIRLSNYCFDESSAEKIKNGPLGRYFKDKNGQNCLDMTEALIDALVEIGINRKNIIDCKIDNFEDERFFSYRQTENKQKVDTFLTIIKNEQ